jgi:uncharacterized membrane protein
MTRMLGTRRIQQGLLLAAGALALAVVAVGLSEPLDDDDEFGIWPGREEESQRPQSIEFQATVPISSSVVELERVWRATNALPLVLRFLNTIETIDEMHARWTLRSTLGVSLILDLQLAEDIPGSLLHWEVTGNGVVGTIHVAFSEQTSGETPTTDLTVAFDLRTVVDSDAPPAPLETFFGDEPSQRLADDLRRLSVGLARGILKVA